MNRRSRIFCILTTLLILLCMFALPAEVFAADETNDFTVVLQNSKYDDVTIKVSLTKTQTTLTALKEAIEDKADGITIEKIYTDSAKTTELTASNIAEYVSSSQTHELWASYTGTVPASLNSEYERDEVSTMILFGMCAITVILLIVVTASHMRKH